MTDINHERDRFLKNSLPDRRRFLAFASAAMAAGCTPRGSFSVAPLSDGTEGMQHILVATSRVADPAPIAYGKGRAETLEFAQLTISIPPTHKIGTIEWPPAREVDPARHFALAGAKTLPSTKSLLKAALSGAAESGEEAVLFVHGYNNNFSEAIYRHAQIAWDYEMRGPQIHFAWPSAADPLEYTYDRDSVLIARDALAQLLLDLLKEEQLRVSVVGHSMGCLLIMEALRQIALTGDREALNALNSITLISPDIDMDLFRSQATALGRLPQPFIVAVARNDRLLWLSSGLSGGADRLGSLDDRDQLEALGVSTIDMTGLGNGGANHFLPGTSASAIALIKGLRETRLKPSNSLSVGPVSISLGG
jgi:esterase/lipase superfamily enzyme|tara:strand:+ start:312 stop:1406 length:1095 start_codon:yes stop_codon:yes gene_type:complete